MAADYGVQRHLAFKKLNTFRSLVGPANRSPQQPFIMLYWTIVFLVVALVAGGLGFGSLAGTAAVIAKVCFVLFIVLFLVSLIRGRNV